MADVGNVRVRFSGDNADLLKRISESQRALNGIAKDVKSVEKSFKGLDKLGTSFKNAGRSLTIGLTLPLVAIGGVVVKAAADMDTLRRGLDSVTGSSSETARQLERLQEAAKAPGLGFREAIAGSIALQTVGLSAQRAERALSAFGNAIALTGGGAPELQRVVTQLSQMSAAGKLLTADLRPILQTAPAVGQALLKAFGTINADQINKLGLSSEQFIDRLVTGLEQLPKATGGIKNSFENLKTTIFTTSAAIGSQLVPAVSAAVDKISELLKAVGTANPELVRWGIAIGAVAAVLGPLSLGLGVIISLLPSLIAGLTAVSGAIAALTGIAIPLLPLAGIIAGITLAVGALSAAFIKSKLDALEAAGAMDRFKASLSTLNRAQLEVSKSDLAAKMGVLRERLERLDRAASAASGNLRNHFVREADAVRSQMDDLRAEFGAVIGQLGSLDKASTSAAAKIDLGASSTEKATAAEARRQQGLRILVDRLNELQDAQVRIQLAGVARVPVAEIKARITPELEAGKVTKETDKLQDSFDGLAVVMGQVDNAAGRFTQQLGATIQSFKNFASGGGIGSLLTGFGGVIGTIATLATVFRNNTAAQHETAVAMRNLDKSLNEFGEALRSTAGKSFAAQQTAVSQVTALPANLNAVQFTMEAQQILGSLGLSFKDLIEFAKNFGINLDLNRRSWEQLRDAIKNVELDKLFNTIAGKLDLLQRRADLLDLTPTQQFSQMRSAFLGALGDTAQKPALLGGNPLLAGLERQLRGLDIATEQGRKALQDIVAQMFSAFTTGKITFEQLGELSPQQFLDFLGSLEGLGDSLDNAADSANKTAEALLNVPSGFKVSLARFNASIAEDLQAATPATDIIARPIQTLPTLPWVPPGTGAGQVAPTTQQGGNVVNVTFKVNDAAEAWRLLKREILRDEATGGFTLVETAA